MNAPVPQWQVQFRPETWENDYAVPIEPLGETTWPITPAEAKRALSNGDYFDDLAADTADTRIPLWVHAHRGPFTVDLACTGCGEQAPFGPDFEEGFAGHSNCAPHAPDAPAAPDPAVPRLPQEWAVATGGKDGNSAIEVVEHACVRDGESLEPFTIELRFEVLAVDSEHAHQVADLLSKVTGGAITGMFDQHWNEGGDQ